MPAPRIQRDMRVGEVVTLLPEAERLLAEYGLHCTGCVMGGRETIEDGCRIHGFSQEDTDNLLTDLNTLLKEQSHLAQKITVTDAAASILVRMMRTEKKQGHCLCVGLDEGGRFFLEFLPKTPRGAKVFSHATVSAVRVAVPPLTLHRIGGATIDYRDGRFTLDVPERR